VQLLCSGLLVVCEGRKHEGGRRREENEKEGKEKKEKNMEIFSNLKIFGEKNKRQFMKLEKIIFL
jgi:hypothetical protein